MELKNNVDEIKEIVKSEEMVLGYFTTTTCNLCKDLFPKIEKMLKQFPNIKGVRAESDMDMKIVGEYSIFTAPTVVLFIQGKETIRLSRKISIPDLTNKIDRYYQMLN